MRRLYSSLLLLGLAGALVYFNRDTLSDTFRAGRDVAPVYLVVLALIAVVLIFVRGALVSATIPGLSIPCGLAIAFCGMRLGIGRGFWMPDFVLRREVPSDVLRKLLEGAAAFYRKMERFVRPRMHFLQRWPGMLNLLGFMIMIGGILLSLPIPPPFPFTNTIPGFAVIFMARGLMERDGVCILIGYFFALVALLYVGLIGFIGVAGLERLWQWLTGG